VRIRVAIEAELSELRAFLFLRSGMVELEDLQLLQEVRAPKQERVVSSPEQDELPNTGLRDRTLEGVLRVARTADDAALDRLQRHLVEVRLELAAFEGLAEDAAGEVGGEGIFEDERTGPRLEVGGAKAGDELRRDTGLA
jgi:hypothetical protein